MIIEADVRRAGEEQEFEGWHDGEDGTGRPERHGVSLGAEVVTVPLRHVDVASRSSEWLPPPAPVQSVRLGLSCLKRASSPLTNCGDSSVDSSPARCTHSLMTTPSGTSGIHSSS